MKKISTFVFVYALYKMVATQANELKKQTKNKKQP